MEKTAYVRVSKGRLKMLEGRANDCKRAEEEYDRLKRASESEERMLRARMHALSLTLDDALSIMGTLNEPVARLLYNLRRLRLDEAHSGRVMRGDEAKAKG